MPEYEATEHHHGRVTAPAALIFAAATDLEFTQSGVIRAIFKTREFVLGSRPDDATRPNALHAQMKALGRRVLAEIPDHEIIMGAATTFAV